MERIGKGFVMLRSMLLAAVLATASVSDSTLPTEELPYRFRSLNVEAVVRSAITASTTTDAATLEARSHYGESHLFVLSTSAINTGRNLLLGEDWIRHGNDAAVALKHAMRDWLDRPGIARLGYTIVKPFALSEVKRSPDREGIVAEMQQIQSYFNGAAPVNQVNALEQYYQIERTSPWHGADTHQAHLALLPRGNYRDGMLYCYFARLRDRADPRTVADWGFICQDFLTALKSPS